jgi:glutathione peroxidase
MGKNKVTKPLRLCKELKLNDLLKIEEKSMKIFSLVASFFGAMMCFSAESLYQQNVTTIEGQKTSLSTYKGKPLLFVNIATQCGYTPQLSGLEKLYQKYKSKGLVVIGIPSNEFGGQTPENDKDVKKFCQLNYGVTFPLTSKTTVLGEQKSPLVQWLLKEGPNNKEIGWNFEKFLVSKQGKVLARFESSVTPEDAKLAAAIEQSLK